MNYGISYLQTGGPFKGMKLALMEDYGVPLLFRDFMKARTQAAGTNLPGTVVISEAVARQLVGGVVEYYSGRRTIQWKRDEEGEIVPQFVIIKGKEDRMSYQQFRNMLVNFQRHKQHAEAMFRAAGLQPNRTSKPKPKMRLRYAATGPFRKE